MVQTWGHKPTNRWTDRCYQAHDLSALQTSKRTPPSPLSSRFTKATSQEAFLWPWPAQTLESGLSIGNTNGKSGLQSPSWPGSQKCLLGWSLKMSRKELARSLGTQQKEENCYPWNCFPCNNLFDDLLPSYLWAKGQFVKQFIQLTTKKWELDLYNVVTQEH